MKTSSVLPRFLAVAAGMALATAGAASISVNFSENSANQGFAGGQLIGPLKTDSSNWNTTNGQPSLEAGSLSGLIDDAGAATGASITWLASNTYWNSDGTGSDEARLSVGYLDDGGTSDGFGVQISVADIPYEQYVVLGLLASGDGSSTYTTLDFTVNGVPVLGGPTTAYKGINASNARSPRK